MEPKKFIQLLVDNGVQDLWKVAGINPSVAIGQSAIETGWGQHIPNNNLFGIKGSFNGKSATLTTWEEYGGVAVTVKDGFRVYPTLKDSIRDYGVFLNVNSRYKKAIGISNAEKQIKAIHNAGYATDSQYSNKVISIIKANNLTQYDRKNVSHETLKVDGYLGTKTIKQLQRVLGVKVDGILGKNTTKALQKRLGVSQDGIMGPKTIKALQSRYGTIQDGMLSKPSLVIKKLQTALNKNKL